MRERMKWPPYTHHVAEDSNLLAILGISVSAAGIIISILLYVRAGRPLTSEEDHAEIEFAARVEGTWRKLLAKLDVRAKRLRSRRGGVTRTSVVKPPSVDTADSGQTANPRPVEHTLHQVAAAYETMSDEELGIRLEDVGVG